MYILYNPIKFIFCISGSENFGIKLLVNVYSITPEFRADVYLIHLTSP